MAADDVAVEAHVVFDYREKWGKGFCWAAANNYGYY